MIKEKLLPFDIQNYLEDERDCLLYLQACFMEDSGDGKLIKKSLGDIARARGISQLAKKAGMSRAGLYKALSEEGDPKLSTFLHILKALNINIKLISA